MPEVKAFTIKRSGWARGGDELYLLGSDGMMCCLGFFGAACDYRAEDLRMVTEPYDVPNDATKSVPNRWPAWLVKVTEENEEEYGGYVDTDAAAKLMLVNDDSCMLEHDREAAITKIFLDNGVTVTFVD